MVAPVRIRSPVYDPDEFKINSSSELLDEVYVNILGNGGDEVLTEEVKWLAVTHKSFDHGRRGYNDRLAFLGIMAFFTTLGFEVDGVMSTGKRIVELQTSLAILTAEASPKSSSPAPKRDSYGRELYRHPALEGLGQLTKRSMSEILDPKRTAILADRYGLIRVMRWKPKNVRSGLGQ